MRPSEYIYQHWGTDWGGSPHPPGDQWRKDFGKDSYPEIAVWNNDGSELWLGMNHEWHTHMPRKQARRLAVHILWCDVRLLFGLRRKVWYWALRRHIAHHSRLVARERAVVAGRVTP